MLTRAQWCWALPLLGAVFALGCHVRMGNKEPTDPSEKVGAPEGNYVEPYATSPEYEPAREQKGLATPSPSATASPAQPPTASPPGSPPPIPPAALPPRPPPATAPPVAPPQPERDWGTKTHPVVEEPPGEEPFEEEPPVEEPIEEEPPDEEPIEEEPPAEEPDDFLEED